MVSKNSAQNILLYIKGLFFKSPWDDNSSNVENIFTKSRNKYPKFPSNFNFTFNNKIVYIACAAFVVLWLASGIYPLKEGEEAVIIRFGKFARIASPGLNYHLPEPIEKVVIERTDQSRRVEIGYRSTNSSKSTHSEHSRYINAESVMLTGDENLIDLNCDVMWHISNLQDFVFNIAQPEETVKGVAESAIREVIGQTPISSILSNQKQEIADKTEALIQKVLDQYASGIVIEKVQLLKAEPPTEVIDSYRDVQTSKADKEREINEAQSYSNDVLPKARGEASRVVQDAEGYKQEVLSRAEGDTQRFTGILTEYTKAKQVTRDRMSLEVAEEVLKGSNKMIIGADVLPYINIKDHK